VRIHIPDLTGEIVAEEKFNAEEGVNTFSPEVSLSPGLYFVRVLAGEDEKMARLVVM